MKHHHPVKFSLTRFLLKSFLNWLPFAAVLSLCFLMIYISVQQNYRQNANDPQIQIVKDTIFALNTKHPPSDVIPTDKIDPGQSLSPFVVIFNAQGQPLSSSVILDGQTPIPPSGVFSYTQTHQSDRFTWEPKPGIRIAAVLESTNQPQSLYVLSGRSLTEVENREDRLLLLTLIGLILSLLGIFILILLVRFAKFRLYCTHR
jgi:hypothetical protein